MAGKYGNGLIIMILCAETLFKKHYSEIQFISLVEFQSRHASRARSARGGIHAYDKQYRVIPLIATAGRALWFARELSFDHLKIAIILL
jgi:hypothetical protein